MSTIPAKTDNVGQFFTAAEYNAVTGQIQSVETDAGGVNIPDDIIQFRKGIASYAAISNFYTCTGVANAYILNPQGSFKTPIDAPSAWNGLLIRFRPVAQNTGASTISLAGLNGGVPINIITETNTPLVGGELKTDRDVFARYNISQTSFILLGSSLQGDINNIESDISILQSQVIPATPTVQGLLYTPTQIRLTYASPTTLTYSVLNANTKDIISTGTINLATVGVDGLDVGSLAANATYHIFEIKNLTTNLVKTITSTSFASPTLPSGYTIKKHVFSFITNASSQLRPMLIHNLGNGYEVEYLSPIDESTPTVTLAGVLTTFTVPADISVKINGSFQKDAIATITLGIGFAHPNTTGTADIGIRDSWSGANGGTYDVGGKISAFTNTSRQLKGFSRPINVAITRLWTRSYTIYL